MVGLLATYHETEIRLESDPVAVLRYDSTDYHYNVFLEGMTSCDNDEYQVWAGRNYEYAGLQGSDVVAWGGPIDDLDAFPFDPQVFGMAQMDNPATPTVRDAYGAVCIGGEIVPWGVDNTPDGIGRSVAWIQRDGAWERLEAPDGTAVVDVLSDGGETGEVGVLTTVDGNANVIYCSAVTSDGIPAQLFSSSSWPVVELEDGYQYLDSDIRDGRIYILSGRVVAAGSNTSELIVDVLQSCEEQASSSRLHLENQGDRAFDVDRPSISATVGNRLIVSDMSSLQVREFHDGEYQRTLEVDVGFNPTNSGIYDLVRAAEGQTIHALVWAYGDPQVSDGSLSENRVVTLEWTQRRLSARCVHVLDRCFE
jgi:hypothetical protein